MPEFNKDSLRYAYTFARPEAQEPNPLKQNRLIIPKNRQIKVFGKDCAGRDIIATTERT